jgi:fumarate hydratase class II
MTEMRKETDSLGVVEVPADKLWKRRATLLHAKLWCSPIQ